MDAEGMTGRKKWQTSIAESGWGKESHKERRRKMKAKKKATKEDPSQAWKSCGRRARWSSRSEFGNGLNRAPVVAGREADSRGRLSWGEETAEALAQKGKVNKRGKQPEVSNKTKFASYYP